MIKKMLILTLVFFISISCVVYAEFNLFNDVSEDNWYYNAVQKVSELGIMVGDDEGNFNPNNNVTRAELATTIERLIESNQKNDFSNVVSEKITSVAKVIIDYEELLSSTENSSVYTKKSSTGSGFFIDSNHIITNAHVVKKSNGYVKIVLSNGYEYGANVINTDDSCDLAILRVDSDKNFPYLKLAKGKMGENIITIGHPSIKDLHLDFTISKGILSNVYGRMSLTDKPIPFYQSDMSVNGGNSGGAVLNKDGGAIGVISANIKDLNNVAFIIPSILIKKFYEESLTKQLD